jgi:hypothetical protein
VVSMRLEGFAGHAKESISLRRRPRFSGIV